MIFHRCFSSRPIPPPNSQCGRWVCEDPFLGYSDTTLFLSYFDKEHKENCIFPFRITLEGVCASSNGSQSRPVHDKKTRDLGIFNATLALEEGGLFHFAYFVTAMELADIMDFLQGLWSNWQLSGLKGCFWAAVKGFRCETLVFKSTEQNVWLLSAPPLSFQRKGGAGGSKDTQKQFAIQHLNGGRFLPPQSLCGRWGGQIEMAQTALGTMVDQERGRENEARQNGCLNEGKTAWLLIVGKCVGRVKRVHGLL